jgi:hypothetical protein
VHLRHTARTAACVAGAPVLLQGSAPDLVYTYTPPHNQTISISTCGSEFDTVLVRERCKCWPALSDVASHWQITPADS